MYVVAKSFNTAIRKFAVDTPITPAEAEEGGSMSFAERKKRGYVKAVRVNYEGMRRPELDALAAERGLDISTAKTNADVIVIIERAERIEEALQTGNYKPLLKAELEMLALQRGLDTSKAKGNDGLIALLEASDIASAPVVVQPASNGASIAV